MHDIGKLIAPEPKLLKQAGASHRSRVRPRATPRDGVGRAAAPHRLPRSRGRSWRAAAWRARGWVDILVNNAGVAWGAEFEDFPEAGWDKVMDLNVKTPFFLTQKMHGLLKAAASADQPAKVINIASVDGLRPNPWETYSYQASKAAMIHLTKRMAARLIKDNIVASCICPGAFPSEMNKAAAKNPEGSAKGIPSRRVGTIEDMAGGAIYLASRAGDYVVGAPRPIDGGIRRWAPVRGWRGPLGH